MLGKQPNYAAEQEQQSVTASRGDGEEGGEKGGIHAGIRIGAYCGQAAPLIRVSRTIGNEPLP